MRSRRELFGLMWEHVDWLQASLLRFDEGHISESKRMAVAIRSLVRDTEMSHSLLGQLGELDRIEWHSSVESIESGFAGPPWIDDPHTAGFEAIKTAPAYRTDFSTWWTGSLLKVDDAKIDRAWLVLSVSNFDGGAHVDPVLPTTYRSISREGGLKPLRINSAGQSYPDASNPVPSGLRTICIEVVRTITTAFEASPR